MEYNALQKIKFLYDQVHQTAERVEHLSASMPLDVHPESLNYEKDVIRFKAEYNRVVERAIAGGDLSERALAAEELPRRFDS
jgi:hypothetical protein